MNPYVSCYVEQRDDGKWTVRWPDGSDAGIGAFKSKGWATRAWRFYLVDNAKN